MPTGPGRTEIARRPATDRHRLAFNRQRRKEQAERDTIDVVALETVAALAARATVIGEANDFKRRIVGTRAAYKRDANLADVLDDEDIVEIFYMSPSAKRQKSSTEMVAYVEPDYDDGDMSVFFDAIEGDDGDDESILSIVSNYQAEADNIITPYIPPSQVRRVAHYSSSRKAGGARVKPSRRERFTLREPANWLFHDADEND